MRIARKTLLASIAAIALAGTCGLALAGTTPRHTLTVQLPDGGIARIQYSGKVAPKVTFGTNPLAVSFFGPMSPFAQLDRISAEMNREMATLLRGSALMPSPLFNRSPLFEADLRHMPHSAHQYTFVSRFSGNGVCMKSVQITRDGTAKPKVVSHSSGNCSGANATALHAAPSAHFGDRPMPIGTWRRMPSNAAPGPTVHEAAYKPHD